MPNSVGTTRRRRVRVRACAVQVLVRRELGLMEGIAGAMAEVRMRTQSLDEDAEFGESAEAMAVRMDEDVGQQ